MNAAFFYGCASHPATGNPLMHSSSHQMRNETLAGVELLICFCGYNKGCSCEECWFTVAFSLLCAEILLSRAWELQAETLLCLSCETSIFSSRDQNANKQQLIETRAWSLYSIRPSQKKQTKHYKVIVIFVYVCWIGLICGSVIKVQKWWDTFTCMQIEVLHKVVLLLSDVKLKVAHNHDT